MGLYDFTDSRDPDRILNRLKRLDAKVAQLRGGVLQPLPKSKRALPTRRVADDPALRNKPLP